VTELELWTNSETIAIFKTTDEAENNEVLRGIRDICSMRLTAGAETAELRSLAP